MGTGPAHEQTMITGLNLADILTQELAVGMQCTSFWAVKQNWPT
jgi:hypothetical protein